MKRIITPLVLFLVIMISSCKVPDSNNPGDSKNGDTVGSNPIVSSTVLNMKEIATTYRPFSTPNFKEADETLINNRKKFIFPCNDGYYYYIEAGDRDGPHRVLAFDNGNGNPKKQSVGDGFVAKVVRENAVYGFFQNPADLAQKTILSKYENNILTLFDVGSSKLFFAKDEIYFCNDTEPMIYKTDYSGKRTGLVADLKDYAVGIEKFAIYESKIWFEYDDSDTLQSLKCGFAAYDLKTHEFLKFDRGGIDLINGGYCYYMNDKKRSGTDYNGYLYRFNCETFCVEQVLDTKIEVFDFYNDYLLYETENGLYKMNGNENKKNLSISQLGEADYFYGVQVQKERIFVIGGAGAFYDFIAEVDIDGKVVKKIHEGWSEH